MGQLDALTLATLIGLTILAWFCLISVTQASVQRRAYRNALATLQSGMQPPLVAYQRYLRSANHPPRWVRIGNWIGTFSVYMGVAAIVLKWRWETFGTADFTPYKYAILLLLLLAIVASTGAPILLAVLTAIWSSAPARSNLRGLPVRPADLVWQRVKYTVIYTSIHSLLWVVSLALVFFGTPLWIATMIGSLCQLLIAVLRAGNRDTIMRWLYPSTPIDKTEWAPLGQRIQAWAQLAGRPLRAVYVQHMAVYRSADWSIVGLGRQRLFVSDMFLASTEWRQCDAYVGLMLGLAPIYQRRERLQFILIGAYWLAFAASLGYFAYLLERLVMPSSSSVFESTSSATGVGPSNIELLYPLLLCLLVTNVFVILSRRLNRPVTKHYLDGDRFSTELVGDPLGLLAALYLVWNYPSGNLVGLLTTNSTIQDRVAALQRRLSMPGPFAPWAFRPIAASLPITIGSDVVSVPLTQEAEAERPGPIPTTRYAISEPQSLAASPVDTRSVADSPTIPTLSFNSES